VLAAHASRSERSSSPTQASRRRPVDPDGAPARLPRSRNAVASARASGALRARPERRSALVSQDRAKHRLLLPWQTRRRARASPTRKAIVGDCPCFPMVGRELAVGADAHLARSGFRGPFGQTPALFVRRNSRPLVGGACLVRSDAAVSLIGCGLSHAAGMHQRGQSGRRSGHCCSSARSRREPVYRWS
jgi:hypothetical protein